MGFLKNVNRKTAFILAVLLVLSAAAAFASTVNLSVTTHVHLPIMPNDKLDMAVMYFDESAEKWVTRGWWDANKRPTPKIVLDKVDVSKGVYYLAMIKGVPYVDKNALYSDSMEGWIDDGKFELRRAAGEKPEGKNVRAVRFYKSSGSTIYLSVDVPENPSGNWHVYDQADILGPREIRGLRELARKYSEKLGVHFVILTTKNKSASNLEKFSRNFYLNNIAGVNGIYECAMMSVNMDTRSVANDFYGELRTMVPDREARVIREAYTQDMTDMKYEKAMRYFLDEASKLVEKKQIQYKVDVPKAAPDEFVHDFGGLLAEDEYHDLAGKLREVSNNTRVGHIAVILDESRDAEYLKRFAGSFYKQNLRGKSAFDGFLVLAVSATSRAVSASPFGSFLPENDVIWDLERMVPVNLKKSLYSGCMYFYALAAGAPEVAPDEFVYDLGGLMSKGEHSDLAGRLRELSLDTRVGHVVVILEDAAGEFFLKRFTNSFYERNLKSSDSFDGFFIMAVSAENGQFLTSAFGSRPKGYDLQDAARTIDRFIKSDSLYEGCLHFHAAQADAWQALNFEMPPMDPDQKIYDFAGVLTEEQKEKLRNAVLERHGKLGVDFLIVFSDISMGKTLARLKSGIWNNFREYERSRSNGNFAVLIIGAPPELKGVEQYVGMDFNGTKTNRKIGYNQNAEIRAAVAGKFREGRDYYATGEAFIYSASKHLSSPIPNVKMVEELGSVIVWSSLAAVVLPGIVVLFLRRRHGSGVKGSKVPARSYFVGGSLRINYISDVFLHSHTSRTKIERKSGSSDRGSSGSSGGGISSRSEGRF